MIRQRFATRKTTKRAFVFDLNNDDPSPKVKVEEDNDISSSIEIGTPAVTDVDGKKDEKVQDIENGGEEFCTPNSPLNCSEVLKEILKHPPLGTSTPRIAVPQNRPKQPSHYPKSLFRNTSSKLTRCSPIKKFAIIKPSTENHPSPQKPTSTSKFAVIVPISEKSQKKTTSSNCCIKAVSVPENFIRNASDSTSIKGVGDVIESPISPNTGNSSDSDPPEEPLQILPVQETVKSFTASESPRSTKKSKLRSPKVNKVAKLRPREALMSPITKEVPAEAAVKSQNKQTTSVPRVKHVSLSKSDIRQVSIDSEFPYPESHNSPQKVRNSLRKSTEIHVPDNSTSQTAAQSTSTKSFKSSKSKGTKSKSKVPREVKLLMEQCYKMENLKSHYHADTGEVEFEQYTRSHKPICYNVDTMLSRLSKQSVSKNRPTKTKSKKNDVYDFNGTETYPKPKKSSTKNSKKKPTTSQSKKNIPEDSGNLSSSFIIKRKKPVAKTISADQDDDENIFQHKKRKVSQDSDSGYCKENVGIKDPVKNFGAVRSKRSLYARNDDDFDYDISPSASTTTNEKHFVKSMKHLVKKTDFRKARKTSKKR